MVEAFNISIDTLPFAIVSRDLFLSTLIVTVKLNDTHVIVGPVNGEDRSLWMGLAFDSMGDRFLQVCAEFIECLSRRLKTGR